MPSFAAAALLFSGAPNMHPVSTQHVLSACVPVTIGQRTHCLIAGHPCNPRYEKQYARHGFTCKRNTAGDYRLWQPIEPGTPRAGQPKP